MRPDWVSRFYAAVDAGDGEAALAQMAPDVEVQFGLRELARGHEAVARTLAAVHAPLAGVRHEFRNVWGEGDTAICEFRAHYTLRRGGELTLPSLTVLEHGPDGITAMRVYIDEGPLHR
jgi:ketosteroid isomerase-like protein